jgi:hypothetical protein
MSDKAKREILAKLEAVAKAIREAETEFCNHQPCGLYQEHLELGDIDVAVWTLRRKVSEKP